MICGAIPFYSNLVVLIALLYLLINGQLCIILVELGFQELVTTLGGESMCGANPSYSNLIVLEVNFGHKMYDLISSE